MEREGHPGRILRGLEGDRRGRRLLGRLLRLRFRERGDAGAVAHEAAAAGEDDAAGGADGELPEDVASYFQQLKKV